MTRARIGFAALALLAASSIGARAQQVADSYLMLLRAPVEARGEIEALGIEGSSEPASVTVRSVTHKLGGTGVLLVRGNYEMVDDSGAVIGVGRFGHVWVKDGDDWHPSAAVCATSPAIRQRVEGPP